MNELIESLSPSALKQVLEKKDKVELVDVRNFDEFQQVPVSMPMIQVMHKRMWPL